MLMQCALCLILKFDLIIIHKFKLLLFTDKKLKIDVKLNSPQEVVDMENIKINANKFFI